MAVVYLLYHPMISLHESIKTAKYIIGLPIAMGAGRRGTSGEARISLTFRPRSHWCMVGSNVVFFRLQDMKLCVSLQHACTLSTV